MSFALKRFLAPLLVGMVSCRREVSTRDELPNILSAPLLADPAPTASMTPNWEGFESFGSCPYESAKETVGRLRPALQECLSQRLPTTVSLRIVHDGSIYSTFVEQPGVPLGARDRQCVDAQTLNVRFPAPACGGSVVRIRVTKEGEPPASTGPSVGDKAGR